MLPKYPFSKKRLSPIILLVVGLTLPSIFPFDSHAQVMVGTQSVSRSENLRISPTFSINEIEYDLHRGPDLKIERMTIGMGASYGLTDSLDFLGEAGYILKSELKDADDDGEGYLLGVGFKGLLFESGKLSAYAQTGFRFINEDYGGSQEGKFFEVPVYLTAKAKLNREFSLYAGMDAHVYSEGEIDFQNISPNSKRETPVGLRLGADYRMDIIVFNPEFTLISEKSFTFRLSTPF